MLELTTPVGRLVSGHPMVSHPVTDDNNQPKMQHDGVTPQIQYYVGFAIPKGNEQHWNQTEWGAKIWNEALAAWPNGEYQQPTFSWKITDGDSMIPNKKMKKPCDREGYPGHWVLHISNGFPIKCYHRGNYDPTAQIQRKEEIKTGDYVRLVITVASNKSTQTAGMYVNPGLFELYQAGVEIVSESSIDAASTLGATAGQLPPGAMIDPNVPAQQPGMAAPVQQPATTAGMVPAQQPGHAPIAQPAPMAAAPAAQPGAAPIAPATDMLTPVVAMYVLEGKQYTAEQLKASGWNDQQIAALPQS